MTYGEPNNQDAKNLLADCYEQMGYQQESPSLRNAFLAGAFELRNGIPEGASPKSSGPDLIKAMDTQIKTNSHHTKCGSILNIGFNTANRNISAHFGMLCQHSSIVHFIDMIAG